MTVLAFLIPVSLLLGGLGLLGFLWMLRSNQFEDPLGQASRVLSPRWDDHPAPAAPDADRVRNPLDEADERP
jgi:cbb3-type cytochrome oxidase maturation protein